jgi:hypothetical protein
VGVKPIARDHARGLSPPNFAISQRLMANAGVIAFAVLVGCSTNSKKIDTVPLPTAMVKPDPWAAFSSNPRVVQILSSSCFDCHSEEGNAAWYVKIAPSYWFSSSARENLNFTDWKDYDAQRRSKAMQAIGRVVNRGEMPPWDYTVFHPAAELSNEQKDLVSEWAARHVEVLPAH